MRKVGDKMLKDFTDKELKTFKQTVTTFIENKDLNSRDPKWNELLPEKIIKFIDQLEEYDYHKDDMISSVPSMIYKLQTVREWEWYSSKLTNDGFEVYIIGIFRTIFLPLLHHQGIPHSNLFIESEGKEYPTRALTDVLTYRKWDPEAMVLSPGKPD